MSQDSIEMNEFGEKKRLYQAVRVNDTTAVDEIEASEEELNEPDDYGYTPLLYAAKYGNLEMLDKLMRKRPKVNIVIKTKKGNFTVLHFLVLKKSIEDKDKLKKVVNDLLDNEEFKKTLHDNHNPLLHLACRKGNHTMVEILLDREEFKHQNNVQHPSTKNTPLHEATLSGNDQIVEMLIRQISEDELFKILTDKEHYNKDEMSPFHIACRDKYSDIVEKFFDGIGCNNEKLEKLANSKGKKQKSPLHFACQGGDEKIVKLLVDQKAVITSNENGTFPIHVVAKYGHCDLVDKVLGEESINVVDEYRNTPLNIATRYNKEKIIEKLLDQKDTDTSIRNKELHTPLICAAIRGNTSACEALVSKGASTDTDANGRNIIHIAAEKNNFKFLKEILKSEEKKAGYTELINLPDKDLNTPLHIAAERGHVECVKILIKTEKVHLDVENERKWTPLYCAAERGHHSVIECLLDKSCRFLFPDTNNNTALHLVCRNGHYEATELLLRSQIGLDKRNRDDHTPLDVAASEGHAKVVELLIRTISESHPAKFLNKLVNPHSQTSKSQKRTSKSNEPKEMERPKINDTVAEKDSQQATDVPEENVDSPLHLAITHDHLEVVKVLIKKEADVKLPNYKTKKTPLQVAIEEKHEAIAKEILKDKKNRKEALEVKWICKDGTSTTPFKELIKRMPTLAGLVLNKAYFIQEDPPGHNASFKFDFTEKGCDIQSDQISTNNSNCCSSRKKNCDRCKPWKVFGPFASKEVNHPLLVMIESNRKELLEHNFIKHICDQKWFKNGIFFYIAALLAYAIFVMLLTAFALLSPNPQASSCEAIMSGTFGQAKSEIYLYNNSECRIINATFSEDSYISIMNGTEACSSNSTSLPCRLTDEECGKCDKDTRTTLIGLMIPILFMVIVQILLEFFQLFTNGFWYLKDWTNYLDIVLYFCCILFVSSAANNCACPMKWQWQIGCIAVFLAWINLLIFLRMGPGGIHILMFEKIFISFWQTILLTFILVVSFSIVFYMQFYTPGQIYIRSPFSTPGRAHIKVMTMTTGELDFDSLFRLDPSGTSENVVEIPFFEVSIILWILFLIMMPILLSNLLTGLAIDDVKKIRERAAMRSLQLKMEFVLHVQELLISCPCVLPRQRKNKRWEKPDPDEKHSKKWKVYLYIITFFNSDEKEDDSIGNSQEEVMESLKKNTRNAEEVKKKIAIMESSLKSSITEIMEEIKTLKSSNREQENMRR